MLLLPALFLALPASAQDRDEKSATIVVTGASLADSEARLAACLARKCPPKEDIEASLAHAENQFIAGDYGGARRTLGKSRGRNNRYAKLLPIEVSDLNRAHGRLSNLDGRPDQSRLLQIEALDALKAGLDDNDTRVFMQQLMVGDEFARVGRLRAAEEVYRRVAKRARKAGHLHVVGYAMLREAVMFGAIASVQPDYRSAAKRKITNIERTIEPELAGFRDAAKLLRASLAAYENDSDALEKAIAAIPPRESGRPVLIYAPPVRLEKIVANSEEILPPQQDDPQWVDVRFQIAADGRVQDAEVLRDSGNIERDWPKLALESVSRRRYAPLVAQGTTRIERFSYVHDLMTRTGSRITGRANNGRLTSLDITDDAPRN
ncbi:MAG: hypothetical protein J7500_01330 [Sphingomonas sp.]|uniref:hypothetical protein n=1 Tax=Sphingomonas sp. TaxID=28214 RepID=UPI001B09F5AD|nr:hypothetical protein [Sphingomonas sp.]MBO9621330.1 hypothetical protein [Sphingomonas sp.]